MHEKWYIRIGIFSIGNSSINHFATIKSEEMAMKEGIEGHGF